MVHSVTIWTDVLKVETAKKELKTRSLNSSAIGNDVFEVGTAYLPNWLFKI